MAELLWTPRRSPHELGVVAHGPVVLARADGIAAALRCVFAHPAGLYLLLVLRASAEWAGDVSHCFPGQPRRYDKARRRGELGYSFPELAVEINGRRGQAASSGPVYTGDDRGDGSGSGGAHVYGLDASLWIGELPEDGVLRLDFAWPDAGLPLTTSTLPLQGLDDVAAHVVPLP